MKISRKGLLSKFRETAISAGFKSASSSSGWIELARSCQLYAESKSQARAVLAKRFKGVWSSWQADSKNIRIRKTPRSAPKKSRAPKYLINGIDPISDAFLLSYEWRRVRMTVLKKYGSRCQCCGASPEDGIKIHVDHIKPRRIFPSLALDPDNLQVLCEVCNHGKGNWDMTDWRPSEDAEGEHISHLKSIATEKS